MTPLAAEASLRKLGALFLFGALFERLKSGRADFERLQGV